jgi:membrane-associated phospholipid phosphatase
MPGPKRRLPGGTKVDNPAVFGGQWDFKAKSPRRGGEMFQTGIHIALQSQASSWLTWLMLQVTASGYYQFIIFMIIAVMFGISLRKGFLLFQIIAWTAVLSEIAKQLFGLPRPFYADSRVACLDPGLDIGTPFRAMGGKGFFDLPGRAVIDAYRLQGLSFGFPSGHSSGAVAMWGGLAVVFRKRALAWLAPFLVLLIVFTRLYLGVHFLADVLGGILLGFLVLFAAWKLIGNDAGRERFFAAARSTLGAALPGVLYYFFLFVLPVMLVLFSFFNAMFAGFFVGLNAAFTLALRAGLPEDKGSLPTRLARVLIAGLLFLMLGLVLKPLLDLVPAVSGSTWGKFPAAALGTFFTVWGGIKLLLLLGLYPPRVPAADRAPSGSGKNGAGNG